MKEEKFVQLLKERESALHRIRLKYFHLIRDRIITGYNLYQKPFTQSSGLSLTYMHSNLKPEDIHFKELTDKLRKFDFLKESVVINDRLIEMKDRIEREADYITKADWENPMGTRYFDFDGIELSENEAKKIGDVIGESFQYDLVFRVENEDELVHLVSFFKHYTSKFRLDRHGKKLIKNDDFVVNNDAIEGAWDIPLLVCTTEDDKKPKNLVDFLAVRQFDVLETLVDRNVTLSTLVRKYVKELQASLTKIGIVPQIYKKYALRVFVEDYIDA